MQVLGTAKVRKVMVEQMCLELDYQIRNIVRFTAHANFLSAIGKCSLLHLPSLTVHTCQVSSPFYIPSLADSCRNTFHDIKPRRKMFGFDRSPASQTCIFVPALDPGQAQELHTERYSTAPFHLDMYMTTRTRW